MPRMIVVVPCYNEERRFRRDAFLDFCERVDAVDLLLVDDGSTDRTLDVLRATAAERPGRIDVLALRPNGGKAEAVRRGMLAAIERNADLTGFWDADLATPLEAIPDFVDVLRERPDLLMVLGSRVKLLGRSIERRATRHYLGRVFATAASLSLRLPVYDTQCGAKMFRCGDELAHWLREPFLTRWIFDVELLARALCDLRARGEAGDERIVELPLHAWRDVAGSKVRPGDFVKAAGELLRIRMKYRP